MKIFLAIAGGLLFLCVGAAMLGAVLFVGVTRTAVAHGPEISVKVNPQPGDEASQLIAGFVLPAGYEPTVSVNVAGNTLMGYERNDGRGHIMFVQVPEGVKVDEEFARTLIPAQQRSRRGEVVNRKPVTEIKVNIRGTESTFYVSDGINSRNEGYREMHGLFQGKNGLAFLSVAMPQSDWDDAEIDAFLRSIR